MLRLPTNLGKGNQLAKRLHAWWGGYYLDEAAPPVGEDAEDDEDARPLAGASAPPGLPAEFAARKAAAWSDPRLQVMERLWGTGFVSPGGHDYIMNLIRPLGLDSTMTVIELGAALGGATRAIAAETGAWTNGYEDSALLAEAAAELSTMAGLSRKAPIEAYDPTEIDLSANSCNTIFSREAFFTIEDKDALFNAVYEALRVDGQLLFTDYMFSRSNISSGAIDTWLENEPVTPKPWSVDEVRNKLTELGFEVRITEDITPDIRTMILAAWSEFTDAFDRRQFAPGWAPALLAEAELWSGRITVLDSGDVGVYRVYGRKYDPALKR
jgi:hypothetical protein